MQTIQDFRNNKCQKVKTKSSVRIADPTLPSSKATSLPFSVALLPANPPSFPPESVFNHSHGRSHADAGTERCILTGRSGQLSDHHISIQIQRIPQQFVRSMTMSRCKTCPVSLFRCSCHSLRTFARRRTKPPILIPCEIIISPSSWISCKVLLHPHLHTSAARSKDI